MCWLTDWPGCEVVRPSMALCYPAACRAMCGVTSPPQHVDRARVTSRQSASCATNVRGVCRRTSRRRAAAPLRYPLRLRRRRVRPGIDDGAHAQDGRHLLPDRSAHDRSSHGDALIAHITLPADPAAGDLQQRVAARCGKNPSDCGRGENRRAAVPEATGTKKFSSYLPSFSLLRKPPHIRLAPEPQRCAEPTHSRSRAPEREPELF